MRKFTAVLRRAGVRADKTLVTVESLHQIVAETTVPFSIFPTVFGGLEIGRITRVYVEDDELRGDVELDGACCDHSKADDWTCSEACYPCDPGCCPADESSTQAEESDATGECPHGADGRDCETGCPCACHRRIAEESDAAADARPPASG